MPHLPVQLPGAFFNKLELPEWPVRGCLRDGSAGFPWPVRYADVVQQVERLPSKQVVASSILVIRSNIAGVAHLVEHLVANEKVAGSEPAVCSIFTGERSAWHALEAHHRYWVP